MYFSKPYVFVADLKKLRTVGTDMGQVRVPPRSVHCAGFARWPRGPHTSRVCWKMAQYAVLPSPSFLIDWTWVKLTRVRMGAMVAEAVEGAALAEANKGAAAEAVARDSSRAPGLVLWGTQFGLLQAHKVVIKIGLLSNNMYNISQCKYLKIIFLCLS